MSAVDVLAVMDDAALSQAVRSDRDDMREARAAVSELIDASEQLASVVVPFGTTVIPLDRLKSALARVGGDR